MKPIKQVAFVLSLLLINFSCKKEILIRESSSYHYFPTERGKYVIYDVDSVYHAENDHDNDDSVYYWHFQIKEVIDDTFTDGQGRQAQIIKRYKRDNDTLDWNFLNVWTQVLTSAAAYKTEDNVPYHKLAFPVSDRITWNGNDANTLEVEIYLYESIHSALTLNSLYFDSTLSVLQRDDDNPVQRIYGKEIFANHVGMIYKERDNLSKIIGVGIVKGTEYKMTIRSYGTE